LARKEYKKLMKETDDGISDSIGAECTTDAMDYAAWKGHLEMVEFLHSIGAECTEKAMYWASKNGHLEIAKYLHSIGEKCTWIVLLKIVIFKLTITLKTKNNCKNP
jgi:ankyrin repeat protein